jgi:hypothetical protein
MGNGSNFVFDFNNLWLFPKRSKYMGVNVFSIAQPHETGRRLRVIPGHGVGIPALCHGDILPGGESRMVMTCWRMCRCSLYRTPIRGR